MKFLHKIRNAPYSVMAAMTVASLASTSPANAAPADITGLADGLKDQIASVGKLLLAGGFLVGVGFVVAGLMKLKQAADTQGQQVKYGEGLWRLAVGAGLVAVPAVATVLTGSAGFAAPSIDGADSGF